MTSIFFRSGKDYQALSPAGSKLGESAKYAGIFLLSSLTALILQPRIGVRDVDAYSYIVGAYSIQAGKGYHNLSGYPLNHWPPGYSLILSLFPSPLQAALFLNYLSFGVAVALIYRIARNSGKWTDLSALGLALALGFIFLRRHASNATPDILTYALFLLALLLHYTDSSNFRIISYLIWGLLIPFKLIAVIFIPAAVLARYLGKPIAFILKERLELFVAFASWSLFLVITLIYNFLTIQSPMTNSHTDFRFHMSYDFSYLFAAGSYLLMDIPRTFLSNWYGSIGAVSALIPFCVVLLVALVCLTTLRLHSVQMSKHALLLVLLSCLLQVGSYQMGGIRLMGYGLILLLLALYPAKGWHKMWAFYGLLGFALGTFNATTQNSLGVNDPRYEQLAHEAMKIESFPKNVPTNSFYILDIHTRVATQPVESAEELDDAEFFFWVSLPRYDAIAGPVSPTEMPGEGWCEVASVTGAKLFRRCTQKSGASSIITK